jgi:hypothetical protein
MALQRRLVKLLQADGVEFRQIGGDTDHLVFLVLHWLVDVLDWPGALLMVHFATRAVAPSIALLYSATFCCEVAFDSIEAP